MPDHTPLHREAAVDKKTRELGIQRMRELQTKKATEAAKAKEKAAQSDRGMTKVNSKVKVIPVKPFKQRDWGESSSRSGG